MRIDRFVHYGQLCAVFLMIVVSACCCAANNSFVDTFSDVSSLSNWSGWPGYQTINGGMLTLAPPNKTNEIHVTSNFTCTYGVYSVRFRTTNDSWNFIYLGWFSRSPWSNPAAYMRLDGGLWLTSANGTSSDPNALVTPYVTSGVWHTLQITWNPGSIVVTYDGAPIGTYTGYVASSAMPIVLDAVRLGDASLKLEIDEVSYIPLTASQTINGVDLELDLSSGIKLNKIGENVTSTGGRLFSICANGVSISSDQVSVRPAEITYNTGGWQIPFNLPNGAGNGWLKFAPGNEPGLVETSLDLTNSGSAGTWRVQFPFLEGLSLDGAAAADVEFFYPFQEGWLGRGQYDIILNYGGRCWLPVLAAWSANGPGVALQLRDPSFSTRWLRVRNSAVGGTPITYHSDTTGVATSFPITKDGASLAACSLDFTLGSGQSWHSPTSVVHIYDGNKKFKEPFASYGRWARATWWTHDQVPMWLRDRFLSFAVLEYVGNAGFVQGLYNYGRFLAGEQAEAYKQTFGGHPFLEWSSWQKHGDLMPNGFFYPHTLGDYRFEDRWGGATAYNAEVARCHNADARVCLYFIGRTVWKQSQVGLDHHDDWGWMDSPGHINEDWSGQEAWGGVTDYWSFCPQVPGWQQYLRDACRTALEQSGADAARLDTEAESLICYNPNHSHSTDPLTGLLTYLQVVRSGIKAAGSDKAMMGEFAGSDAAARYFDAVLSQGHDPNQYLVGAMFGYGLSPFRFVFPEVKLFDWGSMGGDANYHMGSRRALFNGNGVTVGDITNAQLKELNFAAERMRSMGDVFASLDCEPLVSTRNAGVVANRFSLNGREVYTLWNQSGAAVSGQLINITGAAGRRFVNMLMQRECLSERLSGEDAVELSLPNDEVGMIGVFPKLIKTSLGPISCTYTVDDLSITLQAVDVGSGVELSSGSAVTVAYADVIGRHIAVKALRDGYLLQDMMDAVHGNEVTIFFDGFEQSPDTYFTGLPTWKTISGSILTLTPPAKGNSAFATSAQKFLHGCYTCRFKTTVDDSNYLYLGFESRSPWGNPGAYAKLDKGVFKLTVGDGTNVNTAALTSPTVTSNEWHTLSIVWHQGAVEMIYDGVWVGKVTQWVPSTEIPLCMDVQRSATAPMSVQIDEVSVVSTGATATRIDYCKIQPDGAIVGFDSEIVSAAFADYFYVESADRTQGIRVRKLANGLAAGQLVSFTGALCTDSSTGERYVDAGVVRKTGNTGIIKPLGINCRSLGGGSFGTPPAGQSGVAGGAGLNNVGLLVRTWGRVSGPAGGPYTIDDGSGKNINLQVISGILTPGSYIQAIGIVSCVKNDQDIEPVLIIKNTTTDVTLF
ncbi:MAG: DUF6259 domain-containing protein [Armatimonadota bacterium]